METPAKVTGINGNVVSISFEESLIQNEVVYVLSGDARLKSEVIRIEGGRADLQVFESTDGIRVGDLVERTGEMLSAELGPGLLGMLYDGLQNPLDLLAARHGFFLERGTYIRPLSPDAKWEFSPSVEIGDRVRGGSPIGSVPEGRFQHRILVPFSIQEECRVEQIEGHGHYSIDRILATLRSDGGKEYKMTMSFRWPVKVPVRNYEERLAPGEPLITKVRIIDTLFPVARGGCYCTPGPSGRAKPFSSRSLPGMLR